MSTSLLHEDDTHVRLRAEARRFALAKIAPFARSFEERGEFPRELYRELADAGLLGVGYPEDLGGTGGDVSHAIAVSDELIYHGTSVGTCVGLGSHGIALPPIAKLGTDAQRERFARPVLTGERIAALAITEPGAGSDVAGITTRAVRDGDDYVVTGAKMFITSGCRADFFTTAVRTGGPGHAGISMLVIERDRAGVSVGRRLDKMGWWASDTAEIAFDAVRVPAANLLGDENAGFLAIVQNFVTERLFLAANCCSIATLAYDESVRFARERSAFGKSIMAFQVTRHKLADMASRLAAARALLSEAVVRHARGETAIALAAMAKNVATDACSAICDQAVQIHGGQGYVRDSVVERLYRDARLYPIGGGTREIMNEIIAKAEGY